MVILYISCFRICTREAIVGFSGFAVAEWEKTAVLLKKFNLFRETLWKYFSNLPSGVGWGSSRSALTSASC